MFVRPIISLNVERWAESKGIDNELVDGGHETMTMFDSLVVFIVWLFGNLLDALASQWFFGFVVGSLLFAFWDTFPRFIPLIGSKPKQRDTTNSTKAPDIEMPIEKVSGLQKSNRNDFDVVPWKLIVRGTRTDDGIDIIALVQFRNRSKRPVAIKPLKARFTVDGQTPDGKMSGGFSTPIGPEYTDTLRFNSVRVYDEKDHHGAVRLSIMFGSSNETMRSVLSMGYQFKILSYPEDKSTDAVLKLELTENFEYFIAENAEDIKALSSPKSSSA